MTHKMYKYRLFEVKKKKSYIRGEEEKAAWV